jgi:ketosteroid isomerase-like protein
MILPTGQTYENEENMMTEAAIKLTLEDYAQAYCAKDIDSLMGIFDDTDNISVIGTGADELCVGREQVKELFLRNFSEATANKFEWHWVDIRLSNRHAVSAVSLTIHLDYKGQQLKVQVRWTVVLKYENDRWLWIHRHASTAASGQDEGRAYPKDN